MGFETAKGFIGDTGKHIRSFVSEFVFLVPKFGLDTLNLRIFSEIWNKVFFLVRYFGNENEYCKAYVKFSAEICIFHHQIALRNPIIFAKLDFWKKSLLGSEGSWDSECLSCANFLIWCDIEQVVECDEIFFNDME